jgi:hypothetical protein
VFIGGIFMIASRNRSPCAHLPSRTVLAGLITALAGISAAADAWTPQDNRASSKTGVSAHSMARDVRPTRVPSQTALATATVTSCADDGPGSLRAAVATHAAIIDMTALACSKVTLSTGAIVTAADVPSVSFNGPTSHMLTIDANHNGRAFLHNGAGTLTLDHVKLVNGSYDDANDGGCVYSAGSAVLQNSIISDCVLVVGPQLYAAGAAILVHHDLTLNDSLLSGNVAQGTGVRGGAVWVYGKLAMNHSTIRDNVAITSSGTGIAVGGGAYVFGEAQIYASTISGNQAGYEGGLVSLSNATINNSTISGNSAPVVGGLYVGGLLVLDNSTVALNSPTSTFAGVYVKGGVVAHSSIVAHNCYTGSRYCDIECKNCSIVGSKNLIMGANVALPLDTIVDGPLLAPLADNGGPTQTHALLAASPALDKGSNIHDFPFDQRGRPRSAGSAPDIGAFEAGPDSIFANGFD